MKTRIMIRLGLAALVCGLSACTSDNSSTTKNSPLIGTWKRDVGPYCEMIQFRDDGTCTRKLDVPTGLESHEGTWQIQEGDLEMAMQNGSPETVSETHHFDLYGERLVMHDELEMVFHRIN